MKRKAKKYAKFYLLTQNTLMLFQIIEKNFNLIESIVLTHQGGPFWNKINLNKVGVKEALKHPNWKMGKKYR